MTPIRSVCLYCGSSMGRRPVFQQGAARFGSLLAERGIRLVYGGGHIGLMGVAADAALAGGGTVIGIIPKFLTELEAAHPRLSELVIVGSMHERKQRMFELADGFAILPGGLGTLDELIEMITWRQLGLHDKPIVLIDLDGYWRGLTDLIDKVVADGFAKPRIRDLFTVVPTVDDVLPALAAAPAARIAPAPGRV